MKKNRSDKFKIWSIAAVIITAAVIAVPALYIAVIDPFFHFHKPLGSLEYPLDSEWYQNDGILRHFDYDAMMTGTSMVENFKASQIDELFGVNSVKTAYNGSTFLQTNRLIKQAVKCQPELKLVFRSLDFNRLIADDVYAIRGDIELPEYLYNDNPFDDVKYLVNKDVLFDNAYNVIQFTKSGQTTTSFDDYYNWNDDYTYSREAVLSDSPRKDRSGTLQSASDEDYARIAGNMEKNIISVARENPDIEFYYFVPPYSIYYFDSLNQEGSLEKSLKLHEYALQLMLEVPNIRLFSFMDMYSVTDDLNNYKDMYHYGEWVNAEMLDCMKNDEHRLTAENFEKYCADVSDHYLNYDYDGDFTTLPE